MRSDSVLLCLKSASIIATLDRVLVKYEHSISVYDFEIIKDGLNEIRFYDKALSISDNIPNNFTSFTRIVIADTLYKLLIHLDKYSVIENDLQIVVEELERLRNQLSEDLEDEKTEHTDWFDGGSSIYAHC